jgi:hypothetical protein
MNKRKLGSFALCAMLFALCQSAEAQQLGKIPRIGVLSPGSATFESDRYDSFRQGLRELGYVEGKTYSLRFDMQKRSKISFLILLPSWLSLRWT